MPDLRGVTSPTVSQIVVIWFYFTCLIFSPHRHFRSCHFLLPCNRLIPLTWASPPISSPAGHSLISTSVYYRLTSSCSLPDCPVCFCQALQRTIFCFCPSSDLFLISKQNFPCHFDYPVVMLLGSTLPVNVTAGMKVKAVMQNHKKSRSQKHNADSQSDGPLNPLKQEKRTQWCRKPQTWEGSYMQQAEPHVTAKHRM